MLISPDAKLVSNYLRLRAPKIRKALFGAYERSVIGCSGEVGFFDQLITELKTTIESLRLSHLGFSVRVARIHQKPIVVFEGGRCELGDLLVVLKYHLLDGSVERKSIIYQVKMSENNSNICKIDETQLRLLHMWPAFAFGRRADSQPMVYELKPNTLEFGSYMLEPRGAVLRAGRRHAYGSAPTAHTVAVRNKKRVPIHNLGYTRGDVQNFFSHMIFEIGEHHTNHSIQTLVDALYRYVGLDPDPPGEFDGFAGGVDENALFAILEVSIIEGEGLRSAEVVYRTPDDDRGKGVIIGNGGDVVVDARRWMSVEEFETAHHQRRREEHARRGEAEPLHLQYWLDQPLQQQGYNQPQQGVLEQGN